MKTHNTIPKWNLQSIYPSFESEEYIHSKKELKKHIGSLMMHLETPFEQDEFAAWLVKAVHLQNEMGALQESLSAYAYAAYSVATTETLPLSELNNLEEIALSAKKTDVIFRNILADNRAFLAKAYTEHRELTAYKTLFDEELFAQSKQMIPEMEHLAQDLKRSGADSWSRLQEQITSNLSIVWDEKTGEKKTLNELRNLAHDPNRDVRQKAYQKELEALGGVEIPLAAALNGVKGSTLTLNAHRTWESSLQKSIFQSRISQKTVEALISAMEDSLPFWRTYLQTKAKILHIDKCAFYDLFAPVGNTSTEWTYDEAQKCIIEQFTRFSPHMGSFAQKAFGGNWIDAKIRSGKVGGAYCIGFPVQKESRILSNFNGRYSDVTTLAHELGHAYHQEVIKDLPYAQTQYPMTLAETASIFAETIVFKNVLSNAKGDEKKALIETHLQDGCQIIVDILSRFYFESDFFALRKNNEVSAAECSQLMLEAQERTYGEGIKEDERHQYMWAVKSHYYGSDLDFYNFPYAFGMLFAMALYASYEKIGSGFAETYKALLSETGRLDCVVLCKKAGFDIENVDFWKQGISVFQAELEELGTI